jgi:DNA-binding response OmpR family regulator
MSRIAVVDDEKNIRELIRASLEKEYHGVDEYPDGMEAWLCFQHEMPDLIILDILMPKMDGIELCKKIRSTPEGRRVPIIFLSSRDEEIDKVLGLESGADDYVTKPVSLRELTARIRSGLRRTGGLGASPDEPGSKGGTVLPLRVETAGEGCLVLDENRYTALWKGGPLELTVTEFRILKNLAENPGFIKTREQLMAAAFPEDSFPNERAADSHIKRIRRKFLCRDDEFDALESVYGLGYRWNDV